MRWRLEKRRARRQNSQVWEACQSPTGFSLLMLAAASRPDVEHGTTDAAGDPSVRAGAGVSGSRVAGSLISLAAHSQPVSMAFGALGASQSIYSNFLSRGKDVTLPEN